VCTVEAITIEAAVAPARADESYRGVWVFAEQRDGKLKSVAYELLSRGRELADILKTHLAAVCFGHNVAGVEQLIAYGADRVYLVDSPELAANPEDLYTWQFIELIQQQKPEIVIAGATALDGPSSPGWRQR